ncbi:hypothetical protein SAMN05421640_0435 [Ekhidna lutea]|uniref:Outer membrane protein beta-barrel domain-containing protein n=1 Tax=Ekhidna lutea TaxID=447679 RepID=A0A239F1A6_EKHLU|nr:hypothetical protein [Ekhidna lutea]SNS50615.1 hypothetical protein SAMN05421640_0435 [Ekhidna lutea]
MKLKSLLVIILSVAMLGLADNAEAQRKNKYKARKKTNRKVSHYKGGIRGYGRFEPYLFVGAQVNAGNYFGDLAPVNKAASTDVSFTRPGFGLSGGYKFHHSLAITADINWVRIFGDDFTSDPGTEDGFPRYARNLSFRNDIKEFRLALQIFLFPNHGGPNQRLPFNAYLSLGGTVFHHEPKGKVPEFDHQAGGTDSTTPAPQAGEWVKLRPLGTEGQNLGIVEPYKSIAFSLPVALGAQIRLPNTQLNAGIELGIRYLFTDYIDDVSTEYVSLQTLEDNDGVLARIMSDRGSVPVSSKGEARDITNLRILNNHNQGHSYYIEGNVGTGIDGSRRGNPDDNDMFFVTQLKLSYVLGSTTRKRAKYR